MKSRYTTFWNQTGPKVHNFIIVYVILLEFKSNYTWYRWSKYAWNVNFILQPICNSNTLIIINTIRYILNCNLHPLKFGIILILPSYIWYAPQILPKFWKRQPISLCNVVYKIISKLLVSKISHFLHKLIPPNQLAFTPGRWLAENQGVVQERCY